MRKFKAILLTLFCCFMLLFSNSNTIKANAYVSEVPELNAQGVYLMDGYTGKVLYEKNSDTKFEPASTTKIMTAIIALENCNLNEKVTIGINPTLADGSSIGLEQGEIYTVEELLIALLLPSANDAAEALAEHIAGSNAAFGEMMTAKAHEIGATNTTFKNPSGLHEEGHLTTAHDLALIMQYALKLDDFIRISQIDQYYYKNHPYSDGSERWAINQNNCAPFSSYSVSNYPEYIYDNLYSGKTGYTPEANHTYAAAAKKDDQLLVAAFLNADNKFNHYAGVGPLFEWGFNNYTTKKIVSVGDTLTDYIINDDLIIPLTSDRNVYYTALTTDSSNPTISVNYGEKDYSKSTISKGDILFTNVDLLVNGEKYTTVNLLSSMDRTYKSGEKKVAEKVEETVEKVKKKRNYIPYIIVTIVILYMLYKHIKRKIHYNNRKRRIRRKHNF